MRTSSEKELKRIFRHQRIRKKIRGVPAAHRLCVHRSLKNFSAQVIDDSSGKILLGMTTLAKPLREKIKNGGNIQAASVLGELFALEAQKRGVKKVRFDRGGCHFHGRIKAFAEAARKAGMEF